jgi:hypothetical protein
MKWPAPRYATFDEYAAEAMLLGWKYDPRDHTMAAPDDIGVGFIWVCADTHRNVELGVGHFSIRRDAVGMCELGPSAHPDYQGR